MAPIKNVGKVFDSPGAFLDYLVGVGRPKWMNFITAHHTGAPTLKNWSDWQTRKNPVSDHQWLTNLASYYGNTMRWSSGPSFFFTPEHFCVLSPPERYGIHARSFNSSSWGVEMVGNFDVETPTQTLLDWYATGFACLHVATQLEPRPYKFKQSGLHFHRNDPLTNKTCPGTKILQEPFALLVEAKMKIILGGETESDEVKPRAVDAGRKGKVVNVAAHDYLNVRADASAKSAAVGKLLAGEAVTVKGDALNGTTRWLRIDIPGDADGWVAAAYVELT